MNKSEPLTWNWAKKSVLVTGSRGFLGQNLVNRLRKENANLVLVSKSASEDEAIVTTVESEDFKSLIMPMDFDVVYHLGSSASKQAFVDDPINMMVKTLRGVANIADYASNHKNTHVIFPSVSLVYGDSAIPCSERQPPRPPHLYAICKLAAERILITATANLSLLRITNVYGIGEKNKEFPSPVTQFVTSILKDEPIRVYGDGHQARDFIYISDAIEVLAGTAVTNQRGMFNVGTGESHDFLDIISRMAKFAGFEPKINFVPKPDGYAGITRVDVSRLRTWYTRPMISIDEGIKRTIAALAAGMRA